MNIYKRFNALLEQDRTDKTLYMVVTNLAIGAVLTVPLCLVVLFGMYYIDGELRFKILQFTFGLYFAGTLAYSMSKFLGFKHITLQVNSLSGFVVKIISASIMMLLVEYAFK